MRCTYINFGDTVDARTLYSVQCTLYIVHCTLYIVHCTLYIVQCTVYSVQCTPYTVHRTPYTVHRTPYTVHRTPYTVHRTPYTVHRTLYTDSALVVPEQPAHRRRLDNLNGNVNLVSQSRYRILDARTCLMFAINISMQD